MPPRLQQLPLSQLSRSANIAQNTPTSCLRRDFSSTSSQLARNGRMSQARRTMFRFLEGPGKQLKYARPGTTNYLGAYDKQGRFLRGGKRAAQDPEEEDAENEEDSGEGQTTSKKVKSNLPPETQEDLRPFPLNPFFRSEPVLSEELRHEIYRRVVEKGQSVREVSIALQVEMARVGAVVRLMTIEQEWNRQVSHSRDAQCLLPMMKHNKIRLVFKTPTWLQTCFALPH